MFQSKENMPSEIQIYRKFLKNRGLSFTKQRRAILKQVFMLNNHFDAKDIIRILGKKSGRASRATIYRTLEQLERCRLIKKIDIGQNSFYYENIIDRRHHEHICCKKCGKVIEFSDSHLEKKIAEILKKYNYNIKNHSIQIFSICKNCIQ